MKKEEAKVIFDKHYERNKVMIFKMARNLFKTNDVYLVVEEALSRILNELERIKHTKPEKELIGWFFIVTRNLFVDKKRQIDSVMNNKDCEHDLIEFEEINLEEINDISFIPYRDILLKEKEELVDKICKNVLIERDYEFFIFYCDNTKQRVIKKFKCTDGAIRSRVCRITMTLRDFIAQHYKEDLCGLAA